MQGAGQGKGAQTRRVILDAAITRFGRDGYRATSVADIAREAGVGGTVPYAYFPGKEALFLAAVDEDAAAVIEKGLASTFAEPHLPDWPQRLVSTLLAALDQHPLARRLLAGLEPEVTVRVLDIPALNELRKACAELISSEQVTNLVRPDIDPTSIANGIVAIVLSLLMSAVQLGLDAVDRFGREVASVLQAAIEPPPMPRPGPKPGRRAR